MPVRGCPLGVDRSAARGELLPLHPLPAAERHRRIRQRAGLTWLRPHHRRRGADPQLEAAGRVAEVVLLALRRRALEQGSGLGRDRRACGSARSTTTPASGRPTGSTSITQPSGSRSRRTVCRATPSSARPTRASAASLVRGTQVSLMGIPRSADRGRVDTLKPLRVPSSAQNPGATVEAPQQSRVRLGTMLVRAGLLSAEQLEEALAEKAETGKRIGEIVVDRGWVPSSDLAKALAEQHRLRVHRPDRGRHRATRPRACCPSVSPAATRASRSASSTRTRCSSRSPTRRTCSPRTTSGSRSA